MSSGDPASARLRLLAPVDPERDHLRGLQGRDAVVVVAYEDFFCPYCRRLQQVYRRLREALGDRLVYVFRHFPNERVHPGAELAARAAEAAGLQGRFFEMHDLLFAREPPISEPELVELAGSLDLDVDRFIRDLHGEEARARVAEDLAQGRANGVTGTPTLFVDGLRYDGAWDFHSMLEELERPFAARLNRSARVFASLPTSAALVLLVMAVLALVLANSPLASVYARVMETPFGLGPASSLLTLTVREWFSEGLLAIFFLLVGLEIRREMTKGALADWRAALLPIVAAIGGVVAPALIYLLLNRGPTAHGWAIPTATDLAFALALLAILGDRIPAELKVFVAALAVVDDILSVLTLALFYPSAFTPSYSGAVLFSTLGLIALNRARVYRSWPYLLFGLALWLSLHELGVHAALAGVILAMCLPTRPAPAAGPLLAQAATALAELESAEDEARSQGRDDQALEHEPVWEWAARNLHAASDRLASPAERIEQAVGPWTTYVILPMFAFSATGVALGADLSSSTARHVFAGIVLGLWLGKPLGIVLASALALATRLAKAPEGVSRRQFLGGACLCGVGYTVAILVTDRAFTAPEAAEAKLAVLAGSLLAGILGTLVLLRRAKDETPAS